MSEIKTIELSKELDRCAIWHDQYAQQCEDDTMPGTAELHRQWAEMIRSIIIPPPGERDYEG